MRIAISSNANAACVALLLQNPPRDFDALAPFAWRREPDELAACAHVRAAALRKRDDAQAA